MFWLKFGFAVVKGSVKDVPVFSSVGLCLSSLDYSDFVCSSSKARNLVSYCIFVFWCPQPEENENNDCAWNNECDYLGLARFQAIKSNQFGWKDLQILPSNVLGKTCPGALFGPFNKYALLTSSLTNNLHVLTLRLYLTIQIKYMIQTIKRMESYIANYITMYNYMFPTVYIASS